MPYYQAVVPIASEAATPPMIPRTTTPMCDFDGVAVAVKLTVRTGALRKVSRTLDAYHKRT